MKAVSRKTRIFVALTLVMVFGAMSVLAGCDSKTGNDPGKEEGTKQEASALRDKDLDVNAFRDKIEADFGLEIIQSLASKMSNPKLGFRLGGSQAEKENSEYIKGKFEEIGMENITVEPFKSDAFEYKKGELTYGDKTVDIGSYQITFQTNGPKEYELVYAGRGYRADYEKLKADGVDVKGKVVLVDLDQYNEYWINFPAYEAKAQGAALLMACENPSDKPSYAMLSDDQIQTNDICGPADAPAVSVSRNTRADLVKLVEASDKGTIKVTLDVDSKVTADGGSQNVWAEIPGKSTETIILMAHYDSYWKAALDDADGTAVLLTLAKALKDSGYTPEKTLRFCIHGSEEWGMSDSIYDWGIGAMREIKELHPEWADNTFVALNVDSFTVENRGEDSENAEMYKKIRINAPQLDDFAKNVIDKNLPEGYSLGRYDTVANNFFEDFSILTSGVPKMLFTRTDYQSQFDTYHSSEDNYDYYTKVAKQDVIMGDKVAVVGAALMAFDWQLVQPINMASYFEILANQTPEEGESKIIDPAIGGAEAKAVLTDLEGMIPVAKKLDEAIAKINSDYATACDKGSEDDIAKLQELGKKLGEQTHKLYQAFQKAFTRLDHSGTVVAPHESAQANLSALDEALKAVEKKKATDALDKLKAVDSTDLAILYSKDTYEHSAALKTGTIGADKMSWGLNMMDNANQDMYDTVMSLQAKKPDFKAAKLGIETAITDQKAYLKGNFEAEQKSIADIKAIMEEIIKLIG